MAGFSSKKKSCRPKEEGSECQDPKMGVPSAFVTAGETLLGGRNAERRITHTV